MGTPVGTGSAEREAGLTRYFRRLPAPADYRAAQRWLVAGGVLLVLSLPVSLWGKAGCSRFLIMVGLLAGGGRMLYEGVTLWAKEKYRHQRALVAVFPQPSDREVDQWLGAGLARIRKQSLEKIDLTLDECEVHDLPPIVAPVVSYKRGLAPENIVSKAGQDGVARFGVYELSYLWLSAETLAIYHCTFDLIRDAVLNEETREFFYRDIVSVSTREESSSITLATGQSLTTVQEFRVSVANDEYFAAIVGSAQLNELTGAERIPDSGCDRVVRVLRAKLKEKKSQLQKG